MKVWGTHTKGMDHLHRRAEGHLRKERVFKTSEVALMQGRHGYSQRSRQTMQDEVKPHTNLPKRDWSKSGL